MALIQNKAANQDHIQQEKPKKSEAFSNNAEKDTGNRIGSTIRIPTKQ